MLVSSSHTNVSNGLSLTPQQLFQYHTIADLVENIEYTPSNVKYSIQLLLTKRNLSANALSLVKLNEQTLNKLLMTIEEKDRAEGLHHDNEKCRGYLSFLNAAGYAFSYALCTDSVYILNS